MPCNELPPVLYTKLLTKINVETETLIESYRLTTIESTINQLKEYGITEIPSFDDINHCSYQSPLNWNPLTNLICSNDQPISSFNEQQQAVQLGCNAIIKYCNQSSTSATKSICIIGGPGTGKTTVNQIQALFAMSHGLFTMVTSLISERSLQLGGRHIHWIFKLPVNKTLSVGQIADKAYTKIMQDPLRYALLRRVDVLRMDEMGQISAELISTLDIICRKVRESCLFMGGILIISTLDHFQLDPTDGRPLLLSPHMICSFNYYKLCHSVRAAKDVNLQKIQQITRTLPEHITTKVITEFKTLCLTTFSFASDWNDPNLPKDGLYVFGHKAPVRDMIKQRLQQLTSTLTTRCRQCEDLESTTTGNWKKASYTTSQSLSRYIKEPEEIFFYHLARYELTYNKDGFFSQSQLCILEKLPEQSTVNNFQNIKVLIAPPGCKSFPLNITTTEEYINKGWKSTAVGVAPEHVQLLRSGLKAKRRQYGLKHRVGSTIHAVMGQTLDKLITKISNTDPEFSLWDSKQLTVLISRTRFGKDTWFIGNKDETVNALAMMLIRRSQYTAYIEQLLIRLCQNNNITNGDVNPIIIEQRLHPFLPNNICLPHDNNGYVYIIISTKDSYTTYIGQTNNLSRRLHEHNSGIGSKDSADPSLRPWALLAYVTGFDKNRTLRLSFESRWKYQKDLLPITMRNPITIASLALTVINSLQQTNMISPNDLRYCICGNYDLERLI